MSLVGAALAEWLKGPELFEANDNAPVAAAWGELATDSVVSSSLALRAAATVEAARQAVFLSLPVAVETIEVPGAQSRLVGSARRINADIEEYAAAPVVFVIGAEERQGGTTLLTVLRRVAAA